MKPVWLNKKVSLGACSRVKELLRDLKVETVCEQALCPNMGECFGRDQATFLILGRQCTRMCRFCNIRKGDPHPPDPGEPARVAEAAARLGLKHVVITSVTRDDLPDGGAGMFAETVLRVRERAPQAKIEVLVPDFQGSRRSIAAVTAAEPDIFAHNVETVPELYPLVRRGAEYSRSLEVLRVAKELMPGRPTKSGFMLGMGEAEEQVKAVMRDLRSVDCGFLSIGQYLAPSLHHYPVQEYPAPERFSSYKAFGLSLGFLHVESGPYVRSSYAAGEYLTATAPGQPKDRIT